MAKNYDQGAIIKEAVNKGAFMVGFGFKESGGKMTKEPSIKFTVPKGTKGMVPLSMHFHKTYDGTPSDVDEGDMPVALQLPKLDIVERFRPVPGGCSGGVVGITAGTMGCWVTYNGKRVILSNNHVLANSNEAEIGDPILQPGPYDGGNYPQDHFANLTKFERLRFIGEESGCKFSKATQRGLNAAWFATGRKTRFPNPIVAQAEYNLIDAAIATPLDMDDVDNTILKIGPVAGTSVAELGINVQKTGRTTEYRKGAITQVDVVSQVSYGGAKIALFEDQLVVTGDQPFSAGGDSGSAVLDMDQRLTALLFAGSDTVTICCRIENVFGALGVTL